jgi:hypothetical protein
MGFYAPVALARFAGSAAQAAGSTLRLAWRRRIGGTLIASMSSGADARGRFWVRGLALAAVGQPAPFPSRLKRQF